MARNLAIVAADELDAMTPDQRRAEFDRRLVMDPADLPDEFRATAERLVAQRTRQA